MFFLYSVLTEHFLSSGACVIFLCAAFNNAWFLGGDSPGVAISGDSGCGKTSTINYLLSMLAHAGQPVLYIDPTGNSIRMLKRIFADLPERLRKKALFLQPSDLSKVTSFNPLHVPHDGCTDIEWQARVTTKVAHVVRILLSAWGETDLNSKPRLFTWLYRILKTVALSGMSLADCRYFLDPGDDLFKSIIRAVQDPHARRAFEDLAGRRSIDADEQIESARTRLLGFLENIVMQLILGRSDADVLSMDDVIDEGQSVFIDLQPGGTLRDEDVPILANLYLMQFLFAIMHRPPEKRRLYVVCLDELPIFANNGSGPLLMRSVREIRQFLVRYIWAFQGADAFDDPRFFNLALSQLGTVIAMRHTGHDDASRIAGHLGLSSFSPSKVKHLQQQIVQYNEGNDLQELTSQTETWGTAEQQGSSNAFGTSEEKTATNNRTVTDSDSQTTHPGDLSSVADAVGRARTTALGGANARSTGVKTTETTNNSTTASRGGSMTRSQTLVARLVDKLITTGVTFLTPEEQTLTIAARLAGLLPGGAAVYVSGGGVFYVRFPLLKDPFFQTPKFAAKKLLMLESEQLALPYHRTPDEILEQRAALLQATIRELDRLSADPDQPLLNVNTHDASQTVNVKTTNIRI